MHGYLREIIKAAQRSADITRQLLTFARKQPIAPQKLDLNRTVTNMLKMIQRLIGEDICLTWLPGDDLWPVRMDPSQLDQILINLCINARDAIQGTGKITIETGIKTFDELYCKAHPGYAPGEFVLLSVSDDGSGMDKNTLLNIFEPFFTTKGIDKGTGLGLATVYGIVKQNQGFVKVYSKPDAGTTFRIYFRRHESLERSLQTKYSKPTNVHAQGTETILLVEDDPSILKMLRMMLGSSGYCVLAAPLPKEAIRLAREYDGRIDLLVTDVIMPEMNGLELERHLRSIYPELKHLFMSGYTSNVITHRGILNEGIHFISKPFSREEFFSKVRESLDSPDAKGLA